MVDPTPLPDRRQTRRTPTPLHSGDGGNTFDPMEARVRRLEDQFERIDAKLDTLGKDMTASRIEQAEIKGKISNMPTTWQMVGFVVALAIFIFTVMRVVFPSS